MKSATILGSTFAAVALLVVVVLFSDGGEPIDVQGIGRVGAGDSEKTTSPAAGEVSLPAAPFTEEVEARLSEASSSTRERIDQEPVDTEPVKPIQGPFVRGEVRSAEGFPLAAASVKLKGDGHSAGLFNLTGGRYSQRGETDASGIYQVTRRGLAGTDLRAYVAARGYLKAVVDCSVDTESGDAWLGLIELEGGVVFGGQVLDAQGAPVAGAVMRCQPVGESDGYWPPREQERTDEEGRFEFGHVKVGESVLLVRHKDYLPTQMEVDGPYAGFENTGVVLHFPEVASITGVLKGLPLNRSGVWVIAEEVKDAPETDGAWGMELFAAGLGRAGDAEDFKRRERRAAAKVAGLEANGAFEFLGLIPGRSYEVTALVSQGGLEPAACSDLKLVQAGAEGLVLDWDAGARVSFHVMDADTGQPVKNVEVKYGWSDESEYDFTEGSAKLGFSGSTVEMVELRPREEANQLTMSIASPGYLEVKRTGIAIAPNHELDLGVIKVTRAPLVRVHVIDGVTGKGLRSGRVSLIPESLDEGERFFPFGGGGLAPKVAKGRTGAEGWIELPRCAEETATLRVQRSGYADFVLRGVVMPNTGQVEIVAKMFKGCVLKFEVVDSMGAYSPGAAISYEGPAGIQGEARASSKGRARLKGLPAGAYRLRVRAKHEPMVGSSTAKFVNGELVAETEPEEEAGWVHVTLVPGATEELTLVVLVETRVFGVVRMNGEAVRGAEVRVSDRPTGGHRFSGGSSAESGFGGAYEIGSLVPGEHRLRVSFDGQLASHSVEAIFIEGANQMDIDLEGGGLSGRIVDERGIPISGARVLVDLDYSKVDLSDRAKLGSIRTLPSQNDLRGHSQLSGNIDANGHFQVKNLPTGVGLSVSVTAPGYVPVHVSGGLKAGVRGIRIELVEAGSIQIVVEKGEDGFCYVKANLKGSEEPWMQTWPRGGETLLADLKPGVWVVRTVDGAGDIHSEVEVTVAGGERATVTLQAP